MVSHEALKLWCSQGFRQVQESRGFGFRVSSFGFRVQGAIAMPAAQLIAKSLGSRVYGLWFRVAVGALGFGFRGPAAKPNSCRQFQLPTTSGHMLLGWIIILKP